ncbi:putative abortive infection protein [Gottschalkia acidurici 9a]|uniref:Abortive infection protein n=1 Tax=Gottschalkia acidurici (strain ATCC 7906 / DSM 604 / BCRC 14475 / CIP 104303 / KCTC 5404 / NCIMB 10678 / 9a) TaxID=1128398 RepID=K0AZY6_GOTA9|nr:CPBP family intramembrane glutamic endopeptidase [Gottschalkia acidurici]AFS77911.1 putative abortive infection protein [Gottschalkia acidurici 9a]
MNKKVPSILEVNYLYLILAILLLTVGAFAQYKNIYSGIFITEYIIVLLPVVMLVLVKKYDFKKVFRLNKITLKQIMLTILIVILSYPIGMFFNYIMIVIINIFGEIQPSPLPIPENTPEFLLGLFLFAITPGICEEMMFRGIMMSSYEKKGYIKSILFTGILFGIFHFNIQNFLGPTFLGVLFGYMVYKTNSLYTGIVAHTVNNSIALILTRFVQSPEAPQGALETDQLITGLIGLGLFSLFLLMIVYLLLRQLSSNELTFESNSYNYIYMESEKVTVMHLVPILATLIIFTFVTYNYFQYIMK